MQISKNMAWRRSKLLLGAISKRKGGRPTKLNARTRFALERAAVTGQANSARELTVWLQEHQGVNVSTSTVQREIQKLGLRRMKLLDAPYLTPSHKRERLAWAEAHESWTVAKWSTIIFSDECSVSMDGPDGSARVYKRPGDPPKPHHFRGRTAHPPKVMVWACMSIHGWGFITRVDGVLDNVKYRGILEDFLPWVRANWNLSTEDFLFQQDNAAPHRARATLEFFRVKRLRHIGWPAKSPDMNPIERGWALLKKKLQAYPRAATANDLWAQIQEAWAAMSGDMAAHLVRGMPQRIWALKKARGGPTIY
jgi:hypothetical protein